MKRIQMTPSWAPLFAAALILAAPASADWLVTHDGHRVETRGEWRVEGKTILFELPTGELVSMRASEVDLDASAVATREAIEAAASEAVPVREESKPSVYRLTDADVGHVEDEEDPPSDEELDGTDETSDGSLTVTDWSDDTDPTGDGVRIEGELTNEGEDTHGNIRLIVRLYDEDGGFIASSGAELTSMALPPGETARFEVEFPGVFDYTGVRFETEGIGFVTAQPAPAEEDEELLGENQT